MKKILTKGWRLHAPGGNFKKALILEDFQIPFAGSSGSVLLRMKAAPIQQLDIEQIRGTQVCAPTAGANGIGIVSALGTDCKTFKEGDRVLLRSSLCGSWATRVVANEADLIKVPESIPHEYAALLAAGPLAAAHILKTSGLNPGDVVVVNDATSLTGMATLQLAKHFGFVGVGVADCSTAEKEMHVERLKQMGLDVRPDPITNITETFGSCGPKLAVNLCGGNSAAHLARLVAAKGRIVTLGSPLENHVFGKSDLVDKELTVQGFSVPRWLQREDREVLDALAEEVGEAIQQNSMKAFILRHELSNLQIALEESDDFRTIVLMHEGSEKTWINKARDDYMAIDEILQNNWGSAGAEQDPYLKAGRDQPWVLAEALADPLFVESLDGDLKRRLAAITTEAELHAVLDSLSAKDKDALKIPNRSPISVTPEELKAMLENANHN